ncbi:M3 family metallopeptidase [Wenzhouxiangella sp. XN24]|uniref:M3 family metallopeptidase n=1 Tax=Wenzhouxiangella sp. XN24 TaxID=2713569 RepID=UPI0013E9ED8E|nr:M3 family metallopeptidase [Wenzhouxiangella sp. XN24]NGX17671.1 M3 family metallopeptidase [Wenzhouxiangella sp. XN24]
MDNPLLHETGLPAFSRIRPAHVEPAIRTVIERSRAQVEEILAAAQPPRWDNLVMPLEAMEHRLARAWAPVGHLNAVHNTAALREAYNACLPILSDFGSELGQHEGLFRAYERVLAEQGPELAPGQRKILEDALRDFRLAGVALPPAERARFRAIMQELSMLGARFEEHLLDATQAWRLEVHDPARLDGLPEDARTRAREAAQSRGLDGWALTLDFPAYHAVMSHATDRELRREFYTAWVTRASECGPTAGRFDNGPVMEEILRLRHEAARILGFEDYAELSLATKMAPSVAEVRTFLEDLARRSRKAALAEMEAIRQFAGQPLEAWDIAFWSERLREHAYEVSDEELRPYFPADRVMQGLFETAGELFDIRIVPGGKVDTWHDDVEFFRIENADGSVLGHLYTDLYAREQKRGGAWMDECVGRARLAGIEALPVAFLVCNFMPPTGTRPGLLSHDDVVTLFHEFGHCLHHLLTRVDWPSAAGINGVAWDAVELPSQFLENFAWHPTVIERLSGHFESGAPLPREMLERLIASRNFQSAMQMLRQVEFALFDIRLHGRAPVDAAGVVAELEAVRREIAVVPYPGFNRFAHGFSHIFGGGYAAGYYSYKWAEVLSADAFSLFEERGVMDPEAGRRFRECILEVGGSVDALEAFIAFRGRPPEPEPLLRLSGIGTDTLSAA